MTILPGRRLGPYEILSAIGAGGMGEVYKARDTRLDRTVAIKVPPPSPADRSELRKQFERETKTIASLNHTHICTLHNHSANSKDVCARPKLSDEGETQNGNSGLSSTWPLSRYRPYYAIRTAVMRRQKSGRSRGGSVLCRLAFRGQD